MRNEIINDNENIDEMTVGEWLDRMNLSKYLGMFTKNQVYLVSEMHLHLDIKDKSKLNSNFKFKESLE